MTPLLFGAMPWDWSWTQPSKSTRRVCEWRCSLLGESHIELLEPLSPDSPVGKFLEKRGPGIHHIAVRVEDIRAKLAELKAKGLRLIDEVPRVGAGGCLVAFVHPTAANGVLLELVQHQ